MATPIDPKLTQDEIVRMLCKKFSAPDIYNVDSVQDGLAAIIESVKALEAQADFIPDSPHWSEAAHIGCLHGRLITLRNEVEILLEKKGGA